MAASRACSPITERRCRSADDGEVAGVVCGREQQQRLYRRRQQPAAVEEGLLDTGGEVQLRRQWRGPAELAWAELGGQLQQRQWVPTALRDEPFGDLRRRQLPRGAVPGARGQQRGRARSAASSAMPSGRNGVAAPSRAENDQEYAIRAKPAGAEQQRVRGRGVEPVRVLDDSTARCSPRRPAVSIDNVATATRNGSIEGPSSSPNATRSARACGAGSMLAQPHHREQQPVQGRERQGRLHLETLGPQHQDLTRAGNQLLEQGRLADTWFTPDHQAARGPVTSLFEKSGQVRGLEVTAD